MKNNIEDRLTGEWAGNEEVEEFYSKWQNKTPLTEAFKILEELHPDWNLQCELGSWSIEFLEDVFSEIEDSWEDMPLEELQETLQKRIEELYEDCVEIHQFTRLNNVRLNIGEGESEKTALEKTDKETGFPIIG